MICTECEKRLKKIGVDSMKLRDVKNDMVETPQGALKARIS